MAFDGSPTIYWAIGYAIAALLLLLSIKRKPITWFAFLGVSFLLIGFMRMPVILFNAELNPDESQGIAHALTLAKYPIFWDSVDGNTVGPINNFWLVLSRLFSKTIDYTSVRFLALCSVCSAVTFFLMALCHFFSKKTAQLVALPLVFFLAFTQDIDFVHNTSELIPVALLNLSLWLLSIVYTQKTSSRWHYFWIGFVLGILPFAKLQAVPQGAIIGIFTLYLAWRQSNFKAMSFVVFGAFCFPLFIFIYLSINSLWNDFYVFYIVGNVLYATGGSHENTFIRFVNIVLWSPDFLKLFILSFCIGGLFWANIQKTAKPLWAFGIAWFVFGFYAALQPGTDFVHYLNFCVYPILFLYAAVVYQFQDKRPLPFIVSGLSLALWVVPFVYKTLKHQPINQYLSTTSHSVVKSDVAKKILEFANPDTDRMTVWGWACRYHVQTQLPQAAAESHTERAIFGHPIRDKYRARYIKNLQENKPRIFLDAVGTSSLWVQDKPTQGYESFPELKKLIDQRYTCVDTIDDVRIFVLNHNRK
jgi:hypothetical protein